MLLQAAHLSKNVLEFKSLIIEKSLKCSSSIGFDICQLGSALPLYSQILAESLWVCDKDRPRTTKGGRIVELHTAYFSRNTVLMFL